MKTVRDKKTILLVARIARERSGRAVRRVVGRHPRRFHSLPGWSRSAGSTGTPLWPQPHRYVHHMTVKRGGKKNRAKKTEFASSLNINPNC